MRGAQATRLGLRSAAIAASVAVTVALWNSLPANTDIYAPFEVSGSVGSTVSGPTLRTMVDVVRVADKLKIESPVRRLVEPIGEWVVVEATISAVYDQQLPRAELVIGEDRYGPSDRLGIGATLGGPVQPGFLQRGMWVFDVASSVLRSARDKRVSMHVWSGFESRLDSVLVINVESFGRELDSVGLITVKRPTKVVI